MEKNIDVLQNWLKDQGAEVGFLTDPENIAYFSGYHSEPHERVLG
ncbi:aminopeptidase P family N-terminal domain-containing protein, partial [Listeria monocytogenes]|nr:aminopeptidase P family N-terminal domain-containing protein [Listeria monocytogenes]EHL2683624.1 aminopeptidase P family N-terminal domain-containing protein [Listeria monocytogenes]